MSATEELCELLDERGVEYSYEDVTEGTLFVVTRDVRIYYILAREKGFKVWSDWLTPEQAIAATLGNEREQELESLAADMFNWLADYITPEQYAMWESRLEELDIEPTWRWTR